MKQLLKKKIKPTKKIPLNRRLDSITYAMTAREENLWPFFLKFPLWAILRI